MGTDRPQSGEFCPHAPGRQCELTKTALVCYLLFSWRNPRQRVRFMRFFKSQTLQSMSLRVQAAVLIALLLGSLAVLGFDIFTTRVKPEKEREILDQLRKASALMARQAAEFEPPSRISNGAFDRLNGQLSGVTEKVLADFADIEGGFYLGGELDRFSGYAFPTRPRPPHERHKTDPPPLEAPYIRLQAKDSLTIQPGETRSSVRDVESSRVMILTQPVGETRPSRMATWLMYRLVDPRQLGSQVRRYQTSTVMAVGGLALASVLLINLGRLLRRQRRQEIQLREDLRRSEHLASLGKLLAGVAHEVRNPLAAIRSTAQLWQRIPETVHNPGSIDAIVQAVDHLNHTVTQLLLFSRADHADRQAVQVNSLLRETVDLLAAHAAGQNVAITCELASALPPIVGSPSGLRQVFLNLFQNSLQAMPSGGQLTVRTRFDDRGNAIEVIVADTGPGVSVDDQRRLFEPFFTTRSDGTGLGLALCREIILQHDGRIEYLAANQTGAAFQIVLPIKTN